MEGIWVASFVVGGIIAGSFLRSCADRLPNRESPFSHPFRCTCCGHRLTKKEIIPVFSYLHARGQCRYCHSRIPQRRLWVELGTGALFGHMYWHYGLSGELVVALFYSCIFIVLMIIDLEHRLILNRITYPAMAAALVISAVTDEPGIAQSAIGGGIGLGLFLVVALVSRGGMGWGDVKMAALVGLVAGFPLVFVALFLAIVGGGLVALIILLSRRKKRREGIPFGPFLSLAAIATMLVGDRLMNWFLALA